MVYLGDDVEKSFKDVADMGMHTCHVETLITLCRK